MPLLIDNDVTERVAEMPAMVEAMESAFAQLGTGDAGFYPLAELVSPTASTGDCYAWGSHVGAIRDPPRLAFRFKSDVTSWEETSAGTVRKKFNVTPGTYMGFILLFDTTDGSLLAMLNDGIVQHARVGATAGVACDRLSRPDAHRIGMLGSGGMAHTYLDAFTVVRDIEHLTVYSPTRANREAFAAEAREAYDIEATAVDDPETAVRDVDIVATCTSASQAVYDSAWLEDGLFLINVRNVEFDAATLADVDRAVATTNEAYQTRFTGTDAERSRLSSRWDHGEQATDHDTLGEVLAGAVPARSSPEEVIYFDNRAAGIQFAAAADLIYQRALEEGLGTPLPHAWFQQSVKN